MAALPSWSRRWLLGALLLLAPTAARAEGYAPPFLLAGSVGFGLEPQGRVPASCGNPQCHLFAFAIGVEVLWRGLVGPALSIYTTEGQPLVVEKERGASFGDRLSVPLGVAVRPLAFLAWRRGDGYLWRLLAGLGLQVGAALEQGRTALESKLSVGFHGAASLDVPIWGGGSTGGVTLRLQGRLRAGADARLLFDERSQTYQVIGPGTAAQLLVGLAFYL